MESIATCTRKSIRVSDKINMENKIVKAYILHGINDLRYEETEKPSLKNGEVLVKVQAAGICGSDIPRIYTTGTYSYPLIPGHEFAGEVIEIGEGTNQNWLGKRVGIFPLIPCGTCVPCSRRKYETCRHYSYLGSRTDGGFAEYAAVPEWNLIELPEQVSYEQAAMLEPMAVAVHAMRRVLELQQGNMEEKTIVVYGLGTIGILLTMFLKEAGVQNIFTVGNKEFQRQMVLKLGVLNQQYCDSRKENAQDWILQQTKGLGADIFFECVGRNETITDAVACTAPEGMVQVVGNPASDILLEKSVYWKVLRNQLTIRGSWNSSFTHEERDDWHYVLQKLSEGKIRPEQFITQRYGFAELEQGLHLMRDKTEEYVKVMAVW